jgi:hypothetical protein
MYKPMTMKVKLYSLTVVLIALVLFSCRSAKKMYEKGNYDEAVELAAKKLQKKPNDHETIDVLRNAYRFAVEDHESRIRNNAESNNDLRWEWTYHEYVQLQRLYDAIRRTPSVFDIVKPMDYSSYVTTYQEEAAKARYERGMLLMANNDKPGYKQAYYEFQKALSFMPGDLVVRERMKEAYESAVTNVILLPVTRTGFQFSSNNPYNYGNFDQELLRYLASNNRHSFLRFYSPLQANNGNVRTDEVVEMRFNSIDPGRYRDQRNSYEVSKQVVVKETVYSADSVVKEWATVKARVTRTRRTLKADGSLQVVFRDYNDRRLWSDAYRGEYNWVTEFASFTGDARALSEADQKLVNQREEFPPREREIIQIIMDEIQRKAESGIRDYFERREF